MSISIKSQNQVSKVVKTPDKPSKVPELAVVSRVIKGDTFLVMADAAKELEDEFVNLYSVPGSLGNTLAVLPPFLPRTLKQLVKQNNILNQCVQAMEVNIDGTGHEFVKEEKTKSIDQGELDRATAFFREPYPGQSFLSQRRMLRQDLESMGYGYLEVLRTVTKDVVGTRYIEGQTMRLVRLGNPIDMKYTVSRGGKDIELTIKERPRRYMQTFNGVNRQYFKEFGVPLDLNKESGEWANPGELLPAEKRASEVLAFGVDKDYTGPYYLPRWINQLPSVLGSRKAEESNLEFFDSGGMPPAIIFIQGGQMVGDASNQLRTYLSNGNRKKGRAVVVELMSNSGDLNSSSGTVSARVERFGADRMGDGMYDKYDTKAEEHVRVGFRLPPIFVGRSTDYNYATAVIAYQVAEAQVFQPERTEFDEIINKTLMKELGCKTIRFRSLPITMKSVDELIKGLPLVTPLVEGQDVVSAVNTALGLDLKYKEPAEPSAPTGSAPPETGLKPGAQTEASMKPPLSPQLKSETQRVDTVHLLKMVRRIAEIEGLVEPLISLSDSDIVLTRKDVEYLAPEDKALFDQLLMQYARPGHDH